MADTTLPNPFSVEGAKRISEITGQKLAAAPIDASMLGGTSNIQVPGMATSPTHASSIVLPPIQNATVTSYRDNADGTTTNTLNDGSQSTVRYTRNTDGTYTPTEVPFHTASTITNTPQQNALATEKTGLLGDIEASTTKLGTKSARKNELETAQGVPQLNKDIQELYDQANQIDAAAVNMNAKSEDRFAPTFAIRGEQAQIDRQAAAKKAGIAAIASAKTGKLALAQDYATKALTAEFDPIEKQIEHKKFLLQINMDNFSVEEKRRAEAQTIQLDQQKEALTELRTQRGKTLDIMLAAAGAGADNATLAKIQAASSPEEATRLAGAVLGTKFTDQKKQQEFDNNIKLAQLAIDQKRAINDGAAVTDPLQALAYAQQYAATGTIPTGMPKGTFGIVAQLAKELPKPEGALIDANTGTKPAISDAKIDGLAALYDISKKSQELKELDKQRLTGLVPAVFGKTFGSDAQQRYIDLRTEIIDLLSRARTGAALTASEEAFYASQLPGRIANVKVLGVRIGPKTETRIDNFASKIESTLDTKLKAQQAAIVGFSKIKIGGQEFTVGQIVTNPNGEQGRVNADGSITLIQ